MNCILKLPIYQGTRVSIWPIIYNNMASSKLLLLFAAIFLAFFLIDSYSTTINGEWVGHNLSIVEDNQSVGAGCRFEGKIVNWTTHESVFVCFANRLNPQNVDTAGRRKLASRFQIAQKTSANCQSCIESCKCMEDLAWNQLRIEKQPGKLVFTLQDSIKAGAFLQDFIDLWMLGLELSSNVAPENQGQINNFTKYGEDTLAFHTNPYFLACKSEPGQRSLVTNGKIERCEMFNADGKPSCYKAFFCFHASRGAINKMPLLNNWVASECSTKMHPNRKGNQRAQWHGIGVHVCAHYNNPEEINMNATLEFSFAKNLYPTGLLKYSLRENSTGSVPAIIGSKLFSLNLMAPPSVKFINPSGNEVTEQLPEQLSAAIAAVISDNGEPIDENISYTTGTPERRCGGSLLWWLNGHELYDKICNNGPKTIREILGEEAYHKAKELVKQINLKHRKCFPEMYEHREMPKNLSNPPLPPVIKKGANVPEINQNTEDNDLLDGDILRYPEDLERELEELIKNCGIQENNGPEQRRSKRFITPNSRNWWETFPIPYSFTVDKLEWQRPMEEAIDWIMCWPQGKETCMTFNYVPDLPNSAPIDKIVFARGVEGKCSSEDGKRGGTQYILAGDGCGTAPIMAHEILHALGFFHEQKRPDRDDYVWIDFSEISKPSQYKKVDGRLFYQLYDYGSIMHYGPTYLQKEESNKKYVMFALERPYQHTMGQMRSLSFKDIKIMNYLYCTEPCIGKINNCLYGGYLDHDDCEKCRNPAGFCQRCICPDGYAGSVCESTKKSDPVCGNAVYPDYVAEEAGTKSVLSFTTTGAGRCYFRIWPSSGMKRVGLTVKKLKNFKCEYGAQNYLEIGYKKDKTPTGAHLYCIESYPYLIEAEDDTEVMVIVNSNKAGLTVEIEYQATGGNILGKLEPSCECIYPTKLLKSDRSPVGISAVTYDKRPKSAVCVDFINAHPDVQLEWKDDYAMIFCNDANYTLLTVPGGNAIDIQCKKLDGDNVWIVKSSEFGTIRIDDIFCVEKVRTENN